LGDSLSRSIDRGLAKSDYGVVILSPAFFAKKWPEYELRGLTAKELSGSKVILPIWHNVSHDDVLGYSPPLADKRAIQSGRLTPLQIAAQIIETVRPEIFTQIQRRMAWYFSRRKDKIEKVPTAKIHWAPIQHEELPPELVSRVRLIRACLLGAYTHSMDFWLDGFKRDLQPSREISHWEHIAAVYREYSAMMPLNPEQREKVVYLILSLGDEDIKVKEKAKGLPPDALKTISAIYSHRMPIYDIEEEIVFRKAENWPQEVLDLYRDQEKENFPKDLPEKLVRGLMGTTKPQPARRSRSKAKPAKTEQVSRVRQPLSR
jgi:hypothetical protein